MISGARKNMENTTKSSGSMSVELEKALALKEHLGDDFFIVAEKAYILYLSY